MHPTTNRRRIVSVKFELVLLHLLLFLRVQVGLIFHVSRSLRSNSSAEQYHYALVTATLRGADPDATPHKSLTLHIMAISINCTGERISGQQKGGSYANY